VAVIFFGRLERRIGNNCHPAGTPENRGMLKTGGATGQ